MVARRFQASTYFGLILMTAPSSLIARSISCSRSRLHARHQQRGGIAARGGPQRPDALLDRLGGDFVGRGLKRSEQEIEIVRGIAALDMRQFFRR